MNIFQKIKKLDIPNDEYVVVGGGVLVALKLIDWDDDIDMTISAQLFKRFKNEGWTIDHFENIEVLKRDSFDVGLKYGDWDLAELQKDALIINEIPFISLQKLLTWKKEASRQKDSVHIKLIENYIAKH